MVYELTMGVTKGYLASNILTVWSYFAYVNHADLSPFFKKPFFRK